MKTVVVIFCLVLAGCASTPPPGRVPFHIGLVPADCGNRQILLDWLEGQARIPQHRSETHDDFQRTRNEIRKKIWDLRYHCQPV